jgi:hypothetical protein
MKKVIDFLLSDKVYMIILMCAIPYAIVRGRIFFAIVEILILFIVAMKVFKQKPE